MQSYVIMYYRLFLLKRRNNIDFKFNNKIHTIIPNDALQLIHVQKHNTDFTLNNKIFNEIFL